MFGWSFSPDNKLSALVAPYWTITSEGGMIGGLQQADGAARTVPGTRIYFQVDDLEKTLAAVVRAGGTVGRQRTTTGGADSWFATFTEPTGTSFGLWTANDANQ